jgi:hypothetical protein
MADLHSIPTAFVQDPDGDALDFGLTNLWGLALLGNHAINGDIRINYGIGYFRLVFLPAQGYDANGNVRTYPNRSKSLGVEVDLGATFQILDNLSFETKFGYMFNGSAYRAYGYDTVTGAAGMAISRRILLPGRTSWPSPSNLAQ